MCVCVSDFVRLTTKQTLLVNRLVSSSDQIKSFSLHKLNWFNWNYQLSNTWNCDVRESIEQSKLIGLELTKVLRVLRYFDFSINYLDRIICDVCVIDFFLSLSVFWFPHTLTSKNIIRSVTSCHLRRWKILRELHYLIGWARKTHFAKCRVFSVECIVKQQNRKK